MSLPQASPGLNQQSWSWPRLPSAPWKITFAIRAISLTTVNAMNRSEPREKVRRVFITREIRALPDPWRRW
jgi:hypothetical protein